jgi:predicted metal-dependent hydrolase
MDSGPYFQGIALFNQAAFFDSHEVLEEVWREAPEAEKKFLQALIQTAVAFHHQSRGNATGARSLLGRALRNLANYPEEYGGLALGSLRQSIVHWQEALDRGTALPPLPAFKSCVAGEK